MASSTNILRSAVATAIITFSAFGVSANASDFNGQIKQDLIAALGNVFSAQVSALASEISIDITKTIDEGLVEMGFDFADESESKANEVVAKLSVSKQSATK